MSTEPRKSTFDPEAGQWVQQGRVERKAEVIRPELPLPNDRVVDIDLEGKNCETLEARGARAIARPIFFCAARGFPERRCA